MLGQIELQGRSVLPKCDGIAASGEGQGSDCSTVCLGKVSKFTQNVEFMCENAWCY